MNNIPYVVPKYLTQAFNCPHCNAFANQKWGTVHVQFERNHYRLTDEFMFSQCFSCKNYCIWDNFKSLVYPNISTAPLPNNDLPNDIKIDYLEARDIINRSPRGSAALLRLCIQKLCIHLGESGKDINKDIGSLVKKGLNSKIQKSLDIVRVIGNGAVHPGEIDLRDKVDVALKLCNIINIICDYMITQPKLIDETYENLPTDKKKGIENRDK